MIGNEITSVTAPTAQPRIESQVAVPDSVPKLETSVPESKPDYTVSSIRVDVNLDMAILEFKSLETGDIIRQYPTEKQIAGYQRAAQLEEARSSREEAFAENAAILTKPVSQPVSEAAPAAKPAAVETASAATGNVTAGTAQLSDTSSVS